MRLRFAHLAFAVAAIALPVSVRGQDSRPAATQTGAFSLQFTERSPESDLGKIKARMHWERVDQPMPDYDLAKETFSVYVPPAYDGSEAYGLFVFVSPSESGRVMGRWEEVLAKRKLVWIGADGAGNFAQLWRRMGLVLDAAHNMSKRYKIDENRVYLGGFSGGGRTSSRMGVVWADVFDGAMPMGGCDFYKTVTLPSSPELQWRGKYLAPPRNLLNEAKKRSRYVILVGAEDYNREQAREILRQGFLRDGFLHAHYLEMPDTGHSPPSAEWFERGIELLDAPLEAGALEDGRKLIEYRRAQAAGELAAAKQLLEDNLFAGYERLQMIGFQYRGTPQGAEAHKRVRQLRADSARRERIDAAIARQQVEQLLRNGRNYVRHRYWKSARMTLESLLKRYPDTPEAAEAKKLLEQAPAKAEDPDFAKPGGGGG